jgi:hypothetical protein
MRGDVVEARAWMSAQFEHRFRVFRFPRSFIILVERFDQYE